MISITSFNRVFLKKILLLLFIYLVSFGAQGQGRDAWWLFGDSAGVHFVNNIPLPVAGAIVSNEASSCISDTAGNLLFYVGGYAFGSMHYKVFDKNHALMTNGDSISGTAVASQGVIIIPFNTQASKYFIFHVSRNNPNVLLNVRLNYSVVDMSMNGGLGAVVQKNVVMDTINRYDERMAAVRHANGRDWWILSHEISGLNFIKYLIVDDQIMGPYYQSTGRWDMADIGGQMVISPDGTKLFMPSFRGVADLFDFDRCTGMLSNWHDLGDSLLTWDRFYGASFSPRNMFYYSTRDSVWQIDATLANPLASKTLLWVDGNPDACIGQHKLGPDDKIYIVTFRGPNCGGPNNIVDSLNKHLTVIHSPDVAGLASNLMPYQLPTGGKRTFGGLPTMPNYTLGAWQGSLCDTLTSLPAVPQSHLPVQLFPNPNAGSWTIATSHIPPGSVMELTDNMGRLVDSIKILVEDNIHYTNYDLSNGLYHCRLMHEGRMLYSVKVSVVK